MRKPSKVKGLLEFCLSLRRKSSSFGVFCCLVFFFPFRNTDIQGFKLHLGKVILWTQQEGQKLASPL